jgi:hypothetical protein
LGKSLKPTCSSWVRERQEADVVLDYTVNA